MGMFAFLPFTVALIFYVVVFGLLIYANVIADPETSYVVAFIKTELPSVLLSLVRRCLGERAAVGCRDWCRYLLYERNPCLQIVYLFVVTGSMSVVIFYGFPEVYRFGGDDDASSARLSKYHVLGASVAMVACLSSFWCACRTPPGRVTEWTMGKYDRNYEYDGVLFREGRVCPTVGIARLPRSKYCRAAKGHVPRFDHYCGWINQPVGQENYRVFLLFLATQTAVCSYGSVVGFLFFRGLVVEGDLLNANFYNPNTGGRVPTTLRVVFTYLFFRYEGLCVVWMLNIVMGLCLHLFLWFHVYLVCRNITTNEFFKWRIVQRWHRESTRRYETALREGRAVPDVRTDADGGAATVAAADDVDVGCAGPTSSLSTTKAPKADVDAAISSEDDIDDKWDETNNPGPMPRNIYDVGLWNNIMEVLFPLSLRKEAMVRWAECVVEHQKRRQQHIVTEVRKKDK